MVFPLEPLNRMVAPRAGRTILVILDGSQVAGLSTTGVIAGVEAAPSQLQIQDIVEADQVKVGGQLQYRKRGTVTQLIPAKDVTGDQAPASVSIVEKSCEFSAYMLGVCCAASIAANKQLSTSFENFNN